ncbi:MAG: phosphoribosyltransferase family protein [Bacteroidales bacterium]
MKHFDIQLHDKYFTVFKQYSEIQDNIQKVAVSLENKISDTSQVVMLSVLNGAFMFTADLCKHFTCTPFISFIKLASYKGVKSTGSVDSLIGLDVDISHKTVIIVEDIVDTGNTIEYLYNLCVDLQAKEIFVVSLLFKSSAYKKNIPITYYAFDIPDAFVVGYGMDYNGLGRSLKDIYKIT